ncbi:MAG: EAL domain-containing protein [Cellvibrionaceae bacterium]|nr:EAL domain-containing protein [Cellvibrionaceae bacterium]
MTKHGEVSTDKLIATAENYLGDTADAADFINILLKHSNGLIAGTDFTTTRVVFASELFTKLAGVADHIREINLEIDLYPQVLHVRLSDLNEQFVYEKYHINGVQEWEFSIKHKDGSLHLYAMRRFIVNAFSANKDKDARKKVVITLGYDITDHKMAESALLDQKSRINYMSFHDPLTGLANRSLFYDRMHKSVSRAKRGKSSIAILLIDFDRFKNINDSLGHDAGDAFLKLVAQRLQDDLRDTDTVARLGGDEFVVVLENIVQSEDVENIAQKLLYLLAEPVDIQGYEIAATASIGISVFPNDGDSIDQLLKHADAAMYRAKAAGKNRYQFFIKAIGDSAVNYLLLENDLRRAIEQQELTLYYQPQLDLGSNRIIGLEALVRWIHRDRGVVSPAHFIPLAEETGLIISLGEWVLRHACQRFQHWLNAGLNFGKIGVNLSTRQFREAHFEKLVTHVLNESKLAPQYLELEITESSAMENAAQSIDMLNCLSNMGLSLAIDDFGTGYSSLAYLRKFPIQKLKIDRSFIKDIDSNIQDAAIAKSIVDLAHNMSLQVIAEGVERLSQARWLIDRGCDQAQGFYFSKPLSEEHLLAMVEDKDKIIVDASGLRFVS